MTVSSVISFSFVEFPLRATCTTPEQPPVLCQTSGMKTHGMNEGSGGGAQSPIRGCVVVGG